LQPEPERPSGETCSEEKRSNLSTVTVRENRSPQIEPALGASLTVHG